MELGCNQFLVLLSSMCGSLSCRICTTLVLALRVFFFFCVVFVMSDLIFVMTNVFCISCEILNVCFEFFLMVAFSYV